MNKPNKPSEQQELTPLAKAVESKDGTPFDYDTLKSILAHPMACFLIHDIDDGINAYCGIREDIQNSGIEEYLRHFGIPHFSLNAEDLSIVGQLHRRLPPVTDDRVYEWFGLSETHRDQIAHTLLCQNSSDAKHPVSLQQLREYARTFIECFRSLSLGTTNRQLNATILNGEDASRGVVFEFVEKSDDGIVIETDETRGFYSCIAHCDPDVQTYWQGLYEERPPIQIQADPLIWVFAPAQVQYWTRAMARNEFNNALRESMTARY